MARIYRSGRLCGTGEPTRLTPHEVRTRDFASRRRGFDPHDVRAFQRRLADELTALNQEISIVNRENDRLKRALRDWQAMHAKWCDPHERSRGNVGHW